MSKDKDKSETPGSEFVFFHSANVIGFAFKAPFDLQLDEESVVMKEADDTLNRVHLNHLLGVRRVQPPL